MRRAAIILSAALLLGLPSITNAQYNDSDRQNPKEYHDEDSQPLAIVSYLFYPIGYAFEWLVGRPLHYVATESPVAPIFRPVGGNDESPPPPVPVIPDNSLNSAAAEAPPPQDWTPTHQHTTPPAAGGVAQPASPSQSSGMPPTSVQPTMH